METMELINNRFTLAFNNEVIDPKSTNKKELFLIDDKYLIPYLNLIKEYKKIYKLIHNKPNIFNNQKAYKELYKNLFEIILDKYGVSTDEKEYVFVYFSFGVLAIIDKWIEKDCQDDVCKIANLIKKLIGYENVK